MIGYWPFNGNANDESGNGNNGTVNGATLTTDRFGNLNSAYNFSGLDYILGDASNFPSGNSARTISFWYNADSLGLTNNGIQVFGYGGSGCGNSFIMNFQNFDLPGGGNGFYEFQGHCLAFRSATQYPLPANYFWHSITISFNGN